MKKRRRSEAAKQKTIATFSRRARQIKEHEQFVTFFRIAHAGLVLRGYDKRSQIRDAILREVWTIGARLTKAARSSLEPTGKQP